MAIVLAWGATPARGDGLGDAQATVANAGATVAAAGAVAQPRVEAVTSEAVSAVEVAHAAAAPAATAVVAEAAATTGNARRTAEPVIRASTAGESHTVDAAPSGANELPATVRRSADDTIDRSPRAAGTKRAAALDEPHRAGVRTAPHRASSAAGKPAGNTRTDAALRAVTPAAIRGESARSPERRAAHGSHDAPREPPASAGVGASDAGESGGGSGTALPASRAPTSAPRALSVLPPPAGVPLPVAVVSLLERPG